MAALTRPTEANYEVHENVRVDTQGTVLLRGSRRRFTTGIQLVFSIKTCFDFFAVDLQTMKITPFGTYKSVFRERFDFLLLSFPRVFVSPRSAATLTLFPVFFCVVTKAELCSPLKPRKIYP